MDEKLITVTSPLLPSLDDFLPYLQDIWDRKWLTNNGHYHQELEKALCEYLKVPYISLFTNGTLPLMCALQALRITGEVITTPFSFVATTHSLWWNGIKPVFVDIDPDTGRFDVALIQDIVADEDWYDEHSEIGITEAQHIRKSYQVGDRVVTPLKTKDFGRIAAQTAKHVIRQGIREAERSQQLSEIQSRAHDIVQATVTRVDPEKGIVALDLGKGGEAILPRNEQVPGETYTEGQTLQVYVVDVVSGERGARVMISRTHPGLVKRLFELEVPEIYDGTVEVKAISREAGARTKMAVWSKDANVNPVSACIGPHGDRVAAVVEKLGGEKIDIVKWSEDVSEFISAALSPAKVLKVELLPGETRSCRVTVPDQQLSLAIGNKGQNARLCARLTGYNIDIRPESGYYGEDEEPKKDAADAE